MADHGAFRGDTVRSGYHDAADIMAELADIGIDYDDVVDKLERDGVTTFQASWAALAETVEHKLAAADAEPTVTTSRRPSMTDNRIFVIVGASLAGAKAAETLRAEGSPAGSS